MKKIILLFALLISSIGFSQQVVVEDFEGSPDVAGFEGLGSATIKDDPATGGTNGKTLELVTATGGNPWQGATAVFADGILLDITTDKTIKVDVYSTTAFSLFAKVEGTGSPAAGNTQPHTGSGWETLTFSFTTGSDGTATANGDYSKISFFPNRNSDDSGWNSPVSSLTINIDNIKGFLKKVVVEDFEGSPDVAGFEGLGSATIKDDPATGGTNGKTLELVTATGGNPWQGATAVFADGILLDITTDKTIKVDVYSTTAFSLFAKVEGTGSPAAGNTQPHTGSGWETLTFSFTTGSDGTATANGDYSKISFFPNRNSDDSGWNSPVSSLTINIDNISGVKKTVTPPSTSTYDLLESFNGTGLEDTFGGAAAAYDADPAGGSDQVIKITNNGDATWQGVDVVLTTFYKLTAATQLTMQLDVYSTTAITIAPKAQGGEPGSPDSVTSASHTGSGWETLTLTFDKSLDGKVPANGIYGDFALHINWDTTNNTFGAPDGRVFYIKNLKGLATQPTPDPNAPTTAAPTPPTRNAADVISLFSNAYTNKSNVIFGTSWDTANITDAVVAGDDVKKVSFASGADANFVAIDFVSSKIDLTPFTHLHIDIFTTTATLDKSFNHKFSNHATGGDGETSAIQFSTTNASNPSLPDPNPGSWISYDIPFSSFAAAAANGITLRDEIAQYLITSNLGTVYIDNIYVYRAATASVEDNLFNVSLYPNPASNRLNISAANTIQNAEIYNVLGKKVMSVNINKANGSIDVSNLSSGIYLIKYNVNDKVGTAKFIKQ